MNRVMATVRGISPGSPSLRASRTGSSDTASFPSPIDGPFDRAGRRRARATTRLAYTAAIALSLSLWGCGGGGAPTGGVDPGVETQRQVNGRVSYRVTGPRLSQFDANGRLLAQPGFVSPTTPRAAPNVPIEVLAPDGTVLGADTTDSEGRYAVTVNFGLNPGTQVRIRAQAVIRTTFGMVVRIRPDGASDPYTALTPLSGDPDFDPVFGDMPIPELVIPISDGAAAFFMMEKLPDGLVRAKSGILGPMGDLDILWRPGNGAVSSLRTDTDPPQLTVAGGIANDPASNQDCWDEAVIMRLFGLYLLAFHFNDVAPPGLATDEPLIPSVAWREGFLDWWACAGRNSGFFWDTEGIGDDGRVVRYFELESFFDSSLPSLGPDDPNVYQTAANAGVTSALSVAEMLWDIHDAEGVQSDSDGLEFPMFLTLRFLEQQNRGNSYPYLYSLFDTYASDGSLSRVRLDVLLRTPEDHGGATYPGTPENELEWPTRFRDGTLTSLTPGFDDTFTDRIDTSAPTNPDVGLFAKRYFRFDVSEPARADISLITTGNLRVEILALDNTVLAAGTGSTFALLDNGSYIARVTPISNPQSVDFDIRLLLSTP